jgi:ATP-dependent RNA helicase RhlE
MSFDDLGLIPPLLANIKKSGYTTPSPIQAKAIPPVLGGRDLLGLAQTGTGKTAAFALPILQKMAAQPVVRGPRPLRCLVLTPTREWAAQVAESFVTYGAGLPFKTAVIFGGVGQGPQVSALRAGVDVLVACPGRLLDLMGQGHARLDGVETLVLDEADRMFDMGFLPDLRRIVKVLPPRRQTLLFSATMPREIKELAGSVMRDPVEVAVAPVSSAAETVEQAVFFVDKPRKQALLNHLLSQPSVFRAIVFSRTKHGADKIAKHLTKVGITAEAIHGNKSQNARTRALDQFKAGRIQVLVASDIAARGIDVDAITHVVNFDVPNEPETYVHRIGRTGRAGASGTAWSLCDHEERAYVRDIERTIRRPLPVATLPVGLQALAPIPDEPRPPRPPRGGGRPGGRPGGRSGSGRPPQREGGGGGAPRAADPRRSGHPTPDRRDHHRAPRQDRDGR